MGRSSLITFVQKLPGEPFKYEQQSEFDEFEKNAPPGFYVFEIKRKPKPKSQKQLGVIFGLMINGIVRQADEKGIGIEDLMRYLLTVDLPKGIGITKDYMYALMYLIAPTYNDKGERITLSKMDRKQASELFERIRNIMAPMGIVIDDPNPEWKK